MKKTGAIILFLLTFITTNSHAERHDYHFIKEAARNWARAIAAGDADQIMDYYDNRAVLGTSNLLLNTNSKIRNYYRQLLKREHLKIQFNDEDIRISNSGGAATNSGIYVFTYEENGQTISMSAHCIFSYAKDPDSHRWLIIGHSFNFMTATN